MKKIWIVVGIAVVVSIWLVILLLTRGCERPPVVELAPRGNAVYSPPPTLPPSSQTRAATEPEEPERQSPPPSVPTGPWTPYVGVWEARTTVTSSTRRPGELVNALVRLTVTSEGKVTLFVERKMATDGEVHGMVNETKAWPPDFGRDGKVSFDEAGQGTFLTWWLTTEDGQISLRMRKIAEE